MDRLLFNCRCSSGLRAGPNSKSTFHWLQWTSLLSLALTCAGVRVPIQQEQVAQSWQSSVYSDSDSYCFLAKPATPGNSWAYFHSSDVADASGYQWLLLNLTQPLRLTAVTIFARPGELRNRVLGAEVLLGNRLPEDQLQRLPGSRCLASLPGGHAAFESAFSRCGRVNASDGDSPRLDFACSQTDCAKEARFLLIRRQVRSEADKVLNFIGLELEKAQPAEFLTCSNVNGQLGRCSRQGLQRLRAGGGKKYVKACLPCQPMRADKAPNCRLNQPEKEVRLLKVYENVPEFAIYVPECPQCQLQCSYRCFGQRDSVQSVEETLRIEVIPRVVKLQFDKANWAGHQEEQQFWPVDRVESFTFYTESAQPEPEHSCSLASGTSGLCPSAGMMLLPERESLQSETDAGGILTYNLVSRYQLYANASIDSCDVRCESRLPGTDWKQPVRRSVPRLANKCETRFKLPPREQWLEGAQLEIVVDSSAGNPVPTTHACHLQTAGSGRIDLRPAKTEGMRSTYRLTASSQWGPEVSMKCLVNQSGLYVLEAQTQLHDVMHKAKAQISACYFDSYRIAISVATTGGFPDPKFVYCLIGKAQIRANSSSHARTSLTIVAWSFEPIEASLKPTDSKIVCTVIQANEAGQVAFQSVHNGTLESELPCEAGLNIWKVGLIAIATVVIGPFLIAWARSMVCASRKALSRHRRGSWSPSQIPMASYDRNSDELLDGFSDWGRLGAGSNCATSTCNTLLTGRDRDIHPTSSLPTVEVHAPEVHDGAWAQPTTEVVYNNRLVTIDPTNQQQQQLTSSATSLDTKYIEIVGIQTAEPAGESHVTRPI